MLNKAVDTEALSLACVMRLQSLEWSSMLQALVLAEAKALHLRIPIRPA